MSDKKHYEAIKDVHVNLDNRNHAIDEYGYGPLNPKEKNDDFWNAKAKLWKTSVEEAKKSRCYNCAAFNQTPKILKDMGDALGPMGDKIVEKANLGFCEFFYFKCAGDRTCDAWITNGPLKEDAPANATAGIPGTGDDPQAFPKGEPLEKYKKKTKKEQEAISDNIALLRRATPNMVKEESEKTGDYKTGMFAGSQTFIVPSNIFHEAKMQKRKGKHWRTYIGEEDHWRHIREYARKHPNKAIILQDENTGAMCYARYGKQKNLMEVELMKVSRYARLTSRLGDTLSKEQMRDHNEEAQEIMDRNRYTIIGRIGDHDVIHDHDPHNIKYHSYLVRHRETGKIDGEIEGDLHKHAKTFKIDVTSSTGEGPKMHHVYHKILSHGASAERRGETGHYVTSLVSGGEQSEGGMQLWQNLARLPNISVHGHDAANIDPDDEMETHATRADLEDDPDDEMDTRRIMSRKLVASYVKRKTSKED